MGGERTRSCARGRGTHLGGGRGPDGARGTASGTSSGIHARSRQGRKPPPGRRRAERGQSNALAAAFGIPSPSAERRSDQLAHVFRKPLARRQGEHPPRPRVSRRVENGEALVSHGRFHLSAGAASPRLQRGGRFAGSRIRSSGPPALARSGGDPTHRIPQKNSHGSLPRFHPSAVSDTPSRFVPRRPARHAVSKSPQLR
jgi:hypothetical protein